MFGCSAYLSLHFSAKVMTHKLNPLAAQEFASVDNTRWAPPPRRSLITKARSFERSLKRSTRRQLTVLIERGATNHRRAQAILTAHARSFVNDIR